MLLTTTNAIMKIREIIHELMIMQQLNKRDVREITEIDNKEIIIAIFEYEKETIKIVAKINNAIFNSFFKLFPIFIVFF